MRREAQALWEPLRREAREPTGERWKEGPGASGPWAELWPKAAWGTKALRGRPKPKEGQEEQPLRQPKGAWEWKEELAAWGSQALREEWKGPSILSPRPEEEGSQVILRKRAPVSEAG